MLKAFGPGRMFSESALLKTLFAIHATFNEKEELGKFKKAELNHRWTRMDTDK